MEKLKNIVETTFAGLTFIEDTHKYFYKGQQLKKSVSGVIGNFYEPFDEDFMAPLCARKEKCTVDEILKKWHDKRDLACANGTADHLFGEHYAFDRTLKPETKKQEAIVKFWDSLPSYIVPFIMEAQMIHFKYDFAGTGDILLYDTRNGNIHLADYKTNEDLFKNYKGKKMLYPFDHLLDSPYNHYQIQLSLYKMLFEQCGIKIHKKIIIWLLPDGNFKTYETDDYTEELTKYLDTYGI